MLKIFFSQTTGRFGKFRKDFNWTKQKSDWKSPPSGPYFDPCSVASKQYISFKRLHALFITHSSPMTSWLSFRCPSSLHSNLQMSLRQLFSLLHTDFIPPSFQVHHGFSATVELTFSFHHHFSPLRCFFVELQNLIAAS